MGYPKINACAICGGQSGRVAIDVFNTLAYCDAHLNYNGVSSEPSECPFCQYRFDRGNAEWFFSKKSPACINCGKLLDKYNVHLGIFLSVSSEEFDSINALSKLIVMINNGDSNYLKLTEIGEGLVSAVEKKQLPRPHSFIHADCTAEIITKVLVEIKGNEAKKHLKRWAGLFSRKSKDIKKAAKRALLEMAKSN